MVGPDMACKNDKPLKLITIYDQDAEINDDEVFRGKRLSLGIERPEK